MNGFYNGLRETKAAQLAGTVWRTQYVSLIFYGYYVQQILVSRSIHC